MDRRTVLASLGAVVATSPLKAQEPAQSPPKWRSPVIDMHFHMRRTPELNMAHQLGAGITAANLLARTDAAPAAAQSMAQNPAMFPCWFGSADVTKPDAEQLLTQAVKNGAKGFGELKFPVAADGPEMRGSMTWRRAGNVPVLIHFQEVGQPAARRLQHRHQTFSPRSLKAYPQPSSSAMPMPSGQYQRRLYEQEAYPTGPIVPGGIRQAVVATIPTCSPTPPPIRCPTMRCHATPPSPPTP
jgi:hypothetical protein